MLRASRLPDVAKLHPELKRKAERLGAAHMLARERAFTAIFGPSEPPDQILSPDDPQLATAWPGGGIYQFPPGSDRAAWHYVTHNLSQPFPDELELAPPARDNKTLSGFGVEYVISTRRPADWAPRFLLDMVRMLLLGSSARVFAPGHRMSASAFSQYAPRTALGAIIGAVSPEYEHEIRLPGGRCTLVHLVGITPAELELARSLGASARGSEVLLAVLDQLGIGLVTDPARRCVTRSRGFKQRWRDAAGIEAR